MVFDKSYKTFPLIREITVEVNGGLLEFVFGPVRRIQNSGKNTQKTFFYRERRERERKKIAKTEQKEERRMWKE